MDIVTLVIVGVVILLTLAFALYKKILGVGTFLLKILFPLSIIAIFSVLFLPQIYLNFVESNFVDTPLANNLKSIDTTLTNVTTLQNEIVDKVQGLLNWGNTNQVEQVEQYTSNIYGQVVNLLANILRVLVLIISLIILLFLVYIRYAFSGVIEAQNLEKRIVKLERKLETLTIAD
ncbi:hypothetical protein DOJK_00338 [Patescibacteria group bacterium]|nr:hypothetical protein [Candidatus Dojkabacteria bacterium]CAG1020439.1 hypothetical protein DOJK_00338 [Patescibacteria group bacterium]